MSEIRLAKDHISLDFMTKTALVMTCMCSYTTNNARDMSLHIYECKQWKDVPESVRKLVMDFTHLKK